MTNIKTLIIVFAILIGALLPASVTDINAGAYSENYLFPLRTNKAHYASVLSSYSWGAVHESYITRYVFNDGNGASEPYCMVDICATNGTDVVAVKAGTVVENNNHKYGGYNVVIRHTDGTYSYYGHLNSRSKLKKGTWVNAGDYIGDVGSGHLHFELTGEDPYCYYNSKGWLYILNNSGASTYPHDHTEKAEMTSETRYVSGTDGSLALNRNAKSGSMILAIPEGSAVTAYSRTSGNYVYCSFSGKAYDGKTYSATYGWCHKKYLSTTEPSGNTGWKAKVSGCQNLALNREAKVGTCYKALPNGTKLTVFERVGNFYYVKDELNNYGYCWYKYVKSF